MTSHDLADFADMRAIVAYRLWTGAALRAARPAIARRRRM